MASLFSIVLLFHARDSSSLAFAPLSSRSSIVASVRPSLLLSMTPADDGNFNDDPYFEMHQIPTATTGTKLDRVVECAETGECDVQEMMEMIEELERLNLECQGEMSRECSLDAVAARNVLKVALASKVTVEEAIKDVEECLVENPYSDMHEMPDECLPTNMSHQIPTATANDANLDRIIQCAENGESCDVGEMTDMIEELERLNMECQGQMSRECNLDAVEARNILKVALASQIAMEDVMKRVNRKP